MNHISLEILSENPCVCCTILKCRLYMKTKNEKWKNAEKSTWKAKKNIKNRLHEKCNFYGHQKHLNGTQGNYTSGKLIILFSPRPHFRSKVTILKIILNCNE